MAKRLAINPKNVFLSGINGPSPVVKVGDLGNGEYLLDQLLPTALTIAASYEGPNQIRVQSLPTRAREVWRDLRCWYSSDVWSLGVTVSRMPSFMISANREVGTLVISIPHFRGQ